MSTRPASWIGKLLLLVALGMAVWPVTVQPAPLPQGTVPPSLPPWPIRLQAATFFPALGQSPALASEWALEDQEAAEVGYYIVQFQGPVLEDWKQQVEKLGGRLLDYLPEFAFLVHMSAETRVAVQSLPVVMAVSPLQPAYKLSPELNSRTGLLDLVVQTFPGVPTSELAASLQRRGMTLVAADEANGGGVLWLQADASQLNALARQPGVRWIELRRKRVLFNDVARGTAILGAESVWQELGLYGQGQVVAVADTGLDTGNLATLHQDFLGNPTGCTGTGRIVATYALGRTNNWSDSCRYFGINEGGHGTHVAGSVLGNGCRSGSNGQPAGYSASYAGLAPQAGLVVQSVMDSSCGLGGLPADLTVLFEQARSAGARIHTNSWGAAIAGRYDSDARSADLFVWNNKDATVLFSAGNEGVDANRDGYVDPDSIGSPATAKNVITVGASENYRLSGGYNPGGACSTWGGCWSSDYPAEPIKSDRLSNNPTGMAAFSSRGPTDDGRIKPDVVAPGTNILSTKSQASYVSEGWGPGPTPYYQYMGGTSMATPLTAGAVALIRQFYQQIRGVTPSAALLKATLINAATNLAPGQYGSPAEQNPPLPNFAQGWGRVDVLAATRATRAFYDIPDAAGLATGASHDYILPACNRRPIRITLVWSDYPGSTLAAKTLVNDLDLTVTAPDGVTVYRGNVFNNGWSVPGGAADRTNNVESVYLQAPLTGHWTVKVTGYNVPNGVAGRQGYALVMDPAGDDCADFSLNVVPSTLAVCTPAEARFAVAVTATGTFSEAVTLTVENLPPGATAVFDPNRVAPPAVSTLTISPTQATPAGRYDVVVTGSAASTVHSATLTLRLDADAPAAIVPLAPADGAIGQALQPTFTWLPGPHAASYDIQVAADPAFAGVVAIATGLTAPTYTPPAPLQNATAYYWRVRGVNACGVGSFTAPLAFQTGLNSTTSFCRTPALPIPDNDPAGVFDSQTVAAQGLLTDLEILVQARHSWVGDLVFTARNVETNAEVTLIDRPGVPGSSVYGCGQNHVNATLDDQATAPVETQCALSSADYPPPYAIDGVFIPNSPLSVFIGQPLAGTWRLTASDQAARDTGELTRWCLIASYSAPVIADFGDLPASYGMAWHTGDGALRLGAAWDADPASLVDADDSSDDGVSFPTVFQAGAAAAVEVDVRGTGTAGRWLAVWFDWDEDGQFDAEELTHDGPVTEGVNVLSVNIPATASNAVRYRARLYDAAEAPVVSARGGAAGGEVEDGWTPCITPATVEGLRIGRLDEERLELTWEAAAGAAAYELWSAEDHPYFTAGANCAAPAPWRCVAVSSNSSVVQQSGSAQITYAVRAVSRCGAPATDLSGRVGRFVFPLMPGD